jgi:hypothetical protein
LVLLMSQAYGQQLNLTLDRQVHDQYQQLFNSRDNEMHTAVKPYLLSELAEQSGVDSLDLFYKHSDGRYGSNSVTVLPLLDAYGGADVGTVKTTPFGFGGGAQRNATAGGSGSAGSASESDEAREQRIRELVARSVEKPQPF